MGEEDAVCGAPGVGNVGPGRVVQHIWLGGQNKKKKAGGGVVEASVVNGMQMFPICVSSFHQTLVKLSSD